MQLGSNMKRLREMDVGDSVKAAKPEPPQPQAVASAKPYWLGGAGVAMILAGLERDDPVPAIQAALAYATPEIEIDAGAGEAFRPPP